MATDHPKRTAPYCRHLTDQPQRTATPPIVPPPHGPATEEYPSAERYSSAGGPQGCISPQVLTKAWRPPSQRRQWSVHCLGDTNTCGYRNGWGSKVVWNFPENSSVLVTPPIPKYLFHIHKLKTHCASIYPHLYTKKKTQFCHVFTTAHFEA